MNQMLNAARSYLAAGICPVPIVKGTKIPDIHALDVVYHQQVFEPNTWRFKIPHVPTDEDLVYWFGDESRSIAIVTGEISGNLIALDFDMSTLYGTWLNLLNRREIFMVSSLALPVVKTASGHHVYFRASFSPATRTLAVIPESGRVLTDIRGEGGYLMAPPSQHPNGTWYRGLHFPITEVLVIESDIALKLIEAASFRDLFRTVVDDSVVPGFVGVTSTGIQIDGWHSDNHLVSVHLTFDTARRLRAYFNQFSVVLDEVAQLSTQPEALRPDYTDVEHTDWEDA